MAATTSESVAAAGIRTGTPTDAALDDSSGGQRNRAVLVGGTVACKIAGGSSRGCDDGRGFERRVRFVASEDAGAHGTLYAGGRMTSAKDRRKVIGPGLLEQGARRARGRTGRAMGGPMPNPNHETGAATIGEALRWVGRPGVTAGEAV